jgi:hypothetical protein
MSKHTGKGDGRHYPGLEFMELALLARGLANRRSREANQGQAVTGRRAAGGGR